MCAKLLFGAGSTCNPPPPSHRLDGVFRASNRLDDVHGLWASLAPGKLKHAELMARIHVCCGHCESAPHTDGRMLDGLNCGHVMHPRSGGTTTLSVTDRSRGQDGDGNQYAVPGSRHKAKVSTQYEMAALFKTVFVFCLIPIGNDVLCVGHCPFSAETLTQINVVRVTCDI